MHWLSTHSLSLHCISLQKDNLARCVTDGGMSNNNANEQKSVPNAECLDPGATEIMDVTEEWVETEDTDSKIEYAGPQIYSP